jgi:hypothetical protein
MTKVHRKSKWNVENRKQNEMRDTVDTTKIADEAAHENAQRHLSRY